MLERFYRNLWILALVLSLNLTVHSAKAQEIQSDSTRITLDLVDTSFEQILDAISNQSGIVFSFNPKKIPLNQNISYQVTDRKLNDVLGDLSTLLDIEFESVEEQIVIRPRVVEELEAQATHTISGYIKDEGSGETMIGTTIMLEETGGGVISNPYGFYSITLPAGTYTLRYSFIGYKTIRRKVELDSNTSLNIDLVEFAPMLPEIIVESSGIRPLEEIQMSNTKLKPVEVQEMPSLFGEPDVIKSLQSIPGIKPHSDGSTFFYVRGGNKDQNLILVDEAPIYNPSHLLGFFSTIIPDAVKDIKIYKGDIPASQGGRLSSLIDVKTNDGNMKNFQTWGTIGLVSSKLAIEGPFKKDKSSFFLAGRFSRLKWLVQERLPDVETFNFYDLTGKVNFKFNDKNRLYASFYTGEDFYEVESNSGINWSNTSGTIRWNHLFSEKLFANTTFFASKYDYFLITDIARNEKWNSHISNATLKSDFTYFKNPENMISFGVLFSGNNINPGNLQSDSLSQSNPPPIVSRKNAGEFALYFDSERKLSPKWGLRYGIRFGSWTNRGEAFEFVFDENKFPIDTLFYAFGEDYNNYSYLEPRLTISYFQQENASFKFSYNRAVQNIHLVSNSISPFTSLEVWMPSSLNIKPQTSNQVAIGYYKFFPSKALSLETEAYYKRMNRQIDYLDHAQMLLNPTFENQLLFGKAKAYGLELMLRKDEGRLTGWVGYTISRVKKRFDEINGGRAFPAFYDRPHEGSLFLSYQLKPRIRLGLNWNIASGAAYTSPTGFYYYDGQELPVFAERNNDRFQTYHRLDLDAEFRLNRSSGKFDHSISISIFNLYNRNNDVFRNFNKISTNNGNDIVVPGNLFNTNRIYSHIYLYEVVPSIAYNFKFY